ncbi:hypothetical protein [Halorarum salinum]|uniref:DUF8073 domain-containing protein n=1 Tax=Halorarum salinum TaxID=2743089 RepID=A0A7D5QLX2_9EURY|nr:hypothetical protein [Halobaculum salinum]QLG63045.1 hypothetical protein HUG12_15415 [Halobaculum salinum]
MNVSAQLRDLADIVERVEDQTDVEVQDARLAGVAVDGASIRADLTVFVPIEGETESVSVSEPEGDGDPEPDVDVAETDGDEHACDVDDCEYATDTELGLSIHQGRVHGGVEDTVDEEGDDESPSAEERITTVLDKHGELPSSEIELLLETSSSHYRNALSSMTRDGRVNTRQDPEDRRRNLYRLADQEPDEGGDEDVGHEESEPDDADDGHEDGEDNGDPDEEEDGRDDEDDEPSAEGFPRECHCGATLNDSLELAIHRTEEHGVPQATLDHLEPGEFEAIVRDAEHIQDVVDDVGWSRERTLRVIGVYGLGDVLGDVEDGEDPSEESEESGASEDTDEDGQVPDQTTEAVSTDRVDLSRYSIDREDLVDALTGAQTLHHVQRDLGLDRKTTSEILDEIGLLEQLSAGRSPIALREAQDAAQGVA